MLAFTARRVASTISRKVPAVVTVAECHHSVAPAGRRRPTTPRAYSRAGTWVRLFASMTEDQLNERLETFQNLFVEARLSIEDVVDSTDTTYFDYDAEAATEAVAAAVNEFNAILKDIEDADQKTRVLRSNGLKVEQLKGELEMAIEGGHDH